MPTTIKAPTSLDKIKIRIKSLKKNRVMATKSW